MLKEEIEQVKGMIQAAVSVAKAELKADYEAKIADLEELIITPKETSYKEVEENEL
jgi:copper chaperone CopZ